MSRPSVFNVESNTPDFIAAQGYRAVDQFKAAFDALELTADCHVVEPYAKNFETCSLGQFNGVMFKGSGVNWAVNVKEASPLPAAMEQNFKIDLPVSWWSRYRTAQD